MTTKIHPASASGDATSDLPGLVLRARQGDREAFGDLVERFWPQLVALARGVLAADGDAEDLVQESFVHAWQRLWMVRRPDSFAAWMRRIVTRRCLTRLRRLKATEEPTDIAITGAADSDRIDAARLLATLAPRQRAALYLTWIEGCTDKEAGRILGLRPATVRVHRFRGLNRLRQEVEQ